MNMSLYLQVALLNLVLRGVPFTELSSVYGSLHDVDGATESNADWLATELDDAVANNYARIEVQDVDWTDPAGVSFCETLADLVWPTAGNAWGSVTHVALWDDPDVGEGNMLFWFELPNPRTINNGDVFRLTEGNVTVELQ